VPSFAVKAFSRTLFPASEATLPSAGRLTERVIGQDFTFRAGDGIRTHDVQLGKLALMQLSRQKTQVEDALAVALPAPGPDAPELPSDLPHVVQSWALLPDYIKAAVLALVGSVKGNCG